ncbi:hypothetical protein [Lysobacter sp. CA199]|uniref:hypothetical protein n=1 Tax=Lysobacter sp. CA199 TaxID=3455608 RepID=UPI003F8D85D6
MPRHRAHPTPTALLRHRGLLAAALALSAAAGFAHAADTDAEYQAAIASCKAAPKTGSRYVSVTAALMRPVPRSDGGLVTRVPIATEVKVECELDGWVRGHTDGNAPAVGWIRADLLQAKPPTVESLAADYAHAAADQRKTLAERLVALAPYQARGHQALIETLQAAGDTEGARRASQVRDQLLYPKGERLNGEPRLLFAVDRGRVVALARVEDGGTYRATDLEAEAGYYPPRRGLHFYRRGRADGAVQVLESGESVSIGLEAPVRHSSMTARSDTVVGLAANFALDAKSAGAEAVVSPAARKAIESELRAVLQAEKIERAQIDKALKARPGDEDRGGVQIAAFDAGKLGTLHVATLIWDLPPKSKNALETTVDVALILESDGKGDLKTAGRLIQQTGGDVVESHHYFDRLDIDGDGVPELIFQVGRYEGVEYQIWTRGSGQWKSALTGGYVGA